MIQSKRSFKFLPILLLISIQLHAVTSPFSPFNRYNLSYTQLQSRRQSITDTGTVPWLSRYDSCPGSNSSSCFRFDAKGQSIETVLGGLAGIEYSSKSNRFGAVQANVDYTSPFLSAHIAADVFSTERKANSPVNDIQFERFIKENAHEPIKGVFDFRGNISEGYLTATYKSFSLSTGKQKLRWGPGYKGTLGLSGTAYSPFYYYNMNIGLGRVLHLQAFLCGYDDEVTYSKELETNTKLVVKASNQTVKTYFPRYGAGQRIDLKIGRHVQVGIYELVDFFGSNELNRFANPLQMYYLANEASGTNNANMLAGIDFNLVFNPVRIYGEFINDDITVFEKTGNPDKYAWQIGGAWYGNEFLVTAGTEYTHLSKYIYGHSRVLSRHAHWGESMGWPWGNYMDVVSLYGIFKFPRNINARVEANYWLKGDGSLTDEWYADGKPDMDEAPYFPRNPTKIYSMILSAEYRPFSWLTYSLYYEPVVQNKKLSNGFYTYLQCSVPEIRKKR